MRLVLNSWLLVAGPKGTALVAGPKGTASRDFSSLVFFIKQLLLVPMGMPRNVFEFFRIFVELLVFVIDSSVKNTPGSQLESLK